MALITCKECGQPVSDQAEYCPHCGCPIQVSAGQAPATPETPVIQPAPYVSSPAIKRKKPKLLLPIIIIILCVLGGGAGIFAFSMANNYKIAMKKYKYEQYEEAEQYFEKALFYKHAVVYKKYCEAQVACNNADYATAYELIKDSNLPESKVLLEQIYYETRLLQGISTLRQKVKNPDSVEIHQIIVCHDDDYTLYGKQSAESPVFLLTISGQNGFGGYASAYAQITNMFSDDGSYECDAIASTLDYSGQNLSDFDLQDLNDALAAAFIKQEKDNATRIEDAVDEERIKTIVKNGDEGKVKILDELEYSAFAPQGDPL